MNSMLAKRMTAAYKDRVATFFEQLKTLGLSDAELSAVPSTFLPGWGEEYDSSWLKVVIAGKETLDWGNVHGCVR